MIDLHSHILPGLDDGAVDVASALRMARLAVEDGIKVMACTPHIVPGIYENDIDVISGAVSSLASLLRNERIPLGLVTGADVHVAPDLVAGLRSGSVPTLNGSRYFLLEPPHHVVPPRIVELAQDLLAAGYVPIITHPERLSWIKTHYDLLTQLNGMGCRLQVTADALTGEFGRDALSFAWRLLEEKRVDIIASDSHSPGGRPPRLSKARFAVAQRFGEASAEDMVNRRPAAILANESLPAVSAVDARKQVGRRRWMSTLRRIAGIKEE
jgi:protein-tyrosine phosphatase